MLIPSNMYRRTTAERAKAFTLIETVVVISILSLVSLVLTSAIRYFYRTNDYVLQESTAVGNARNGLNIAMNSLREASYGDDGSYPIASAATSSVTFYANITSLTSVQKVRLYLQNGTLYEAVTSSAGNPPTYPATPTLTNIVAMYVTNGTSTPIFQYYDSNGNPLSYPVTVPFIASIGTTLKIDVDPNRSPAVYTLIGTATLRNLRSH